MDENEKDWHNIKRIHVLKKGYHGVDAALRPPSCCQHFWNAKWDWDGDIIAKSIIFFLQVDYTTKDPGL